MKVQVILDKDNYIESYSIIEENPSSELLDSITIDIDEDAQTFHYVYDAYKVENDQIIFDKEKLTEIYNNNVSLELSPIEKLELKIQELELRIQNLENK